MRGVRDYMRKNLWNSFWRICASRFPLHAVGGFHLTIDQPHLPYQWRELTWETEGRHISDSLWSSRYCRSSGESEPQELQETGFLLQGDRKGLHSKGSQLRRPGCTQGQSSEVPLGRQESIRNQSKRIGLGETTLRLGSLVKSEHSLLTYLQHHGRQKYWEHDDSHIITSLSLLEPHALQRNYIGKHSAWGNSQRGRELGQEEDDFQIILEWW